MNTNRFNWHPLAALALLFFGVTPALKYGGIWELHEHPLPGVAVKLHDGRQLQGALSHAWSGDWVLSTSDGTSIQFDEHAYDVLEFAPPESPRPTFAESFARKWREHLPFLLIVALASVLVLSGITTSLRRDAHR